MNGQSYTTTMVIDRTPEEAFAAVTNVRGWWSENIDGPTDQLGAEFVFEAEEIHRSRMKIVEFVPNERVVWLCLENHMNYVADQTEWVGTRVVFEISTVDAGTQVRFTHRGLVPEYECFEICSNAWSGYVNGSLRALITTGTGKPEKRRAVQAN